MLSLLTALVLAQTYPVLTNATLTTSGSDYETGLTSGEVDLTVDVTGTVSGTTPTLTFCIQPSDPMAPTSTISGDAAQLCGSALTATGQQSSLALTGIRSGAVFITWTITGTNPSFGGTNVTLKNNAGPYSSAGTVTANQGTANTLSHAWPIEATDGTNGPAAVKASTTAAIATDPSLVVALSPNSVGLVQGKSATNTAVTNPIEGANRATADGAAPAAVTSGNQGQSIGDTYGRQMVQTFHPNHWSCLLNGITTTTQCLASPGAGLSIYVTDMVLNVTAVTTTEQLSTGTGANCGAGNAVLTPVFVFAADGTITADFQTPIKLPANQELCCGTNAAGSCLINGFIAP